MSNAGVWSSWTALQSPVQTGVLNEVITNVRNYPNPFDPRKGGTEGKTYITYTLAENSEVTITLYDLLGYVVKEYKFSSGQDGAKPGPNLVPWDGKNGLGGFVSKGGYIVRIKASSPRGSKVIIRKIGVIH
jgi:flagellar hook assembly protein FlgD